MSRTWSARSAMKVSSSAARRGSESAMIRMARSAAFRAPLTATVATGIPLGICTMARSESSPPRLASATGTPITGSGVVAATTPLPVIGVPVALANLGGLDSLLAMVQMPKGIPVATVAVNGARNAALLAIRIMALSDPRLAAELDTFIADLADQVRDMDAEVVARYQQG